MHVICPCHSQEINKYCDNRTVMTYAWTVLATVPSEMYFPLYAITVNHYRESDVWSLSLRAHF